MAETTMSSQPVTSFPKGRIRVALLENIHAHAAAVFEAEGLRVTMISGALKGGALAELLADTHLIGIRSKTHLDAAALAGAPRLLAIGCFCIGTNQVDLDAAANHGIPVFNAPFSNTRSVAELTIAEVVALMRRLGDRSAQMHAGRWIKSASGSHEIRGRTLGIVGYGHIGTQVSVLAEAMGMRVVFFDTSAKLALGNASPTGSLDELLGVADVVTLHVPATETTDGMIGAEQIAQMKRGAMLINNARGSVVDIDALARAITSGHLGGAALDVFPAEPASGDEPFESPVRGLGNVILTPHIGGSTIEAQQSIAQDVAAKLMRFLDVGATSGAVNVPPIELAPQSGADRPHRILHFHRNVPGVLSQIHTLTARLGVNVAAERLGTHGDLGYLVLDVDQADSKALIAGLKAIPETIRVRALW